MFSALACRTISQRAQHAHTPLIHFPARQADASSQPLSTLSKNFTAPPTQYSNTLFKRKPLSEDEIELINLGGAIPDKPKPAAAVPAKKPTK